MAEGCRTGEFGMASAIRLEIGSAGQGRAYPYDDVMVARVRIGNLCHTDAAGFFEDAGLHLIRFGSAAILPDCRDLISEDQAVNRRCVSDHRGRRESSGMATGENGRKHGARQQGGTKPEEMSDVIYRNPALAADAIIELDSGGIVLIERKNEPHGWAIPGGFVDYGESIECAAVREAREETGLEVELIELFQVYSDPARDPRKHTVTAVFIARATGTPEAADDAADAGIFKADTLPAPLAFDHADVLAHYFRYRRTGERTALAYPPR